MSQPNGLLGWETRCAEAQYNINKLAKLLGFSPGHLRRLFRQKFGCSLGERMRSLRIERLKKLVAQGRSLKEIAVELGFHHPSYVSALIARVIGCNISSYRRARAGLLSPPAAIPMLTEFSTTITASTCQHLLISTIVFVVEPRTAGNTVQP